MVLAPILHLSFYFLFFCLRGKHRNTAVAGRAPSRAVRSDRDPVNKIGSETILAGEVQPGNPIEAVDPVPSTGKPKSAVRSYSDRLNIVCG